MNADGSRKTTIYTAPSLPSAVMLIGEPIWSPDAKHIAFTRCIRGTGNTCVTQLFTCDIAVVNDMPIMENATLLVSGLEWTAPIAWNPNPATNEIAFTVSNDSTRTIETVPAAGGTPTVLFTAPTLHLVSDPSYSADGLQLAFKDIDRSVSPSEYSIVIIDRASKTMQEKINIRGASDLDFPQWSHSAGDTRIAFAATFPEGGGTSGIFMVDAANPNAPPMQVLTSRTGYCSPSVSSPFTWSPDSSKMLIGNISSHKIGCLDLSTGAVSPVASATSGTGQFDWRRF
jgi:Tol biopolymer transport system component